MKHQSKGLLAMLLVVPACIVVWHLSSSETSEFAGAGEPQSAPSHLALPVAEVVRSPESLEREIPTTAQREFMTQAIKAQMHDIAIAYESNIRFPTYSKPLSLDDWSLLNPRPFVERKVPLDINAQISASIVLKHYIVHRDEDLEAQVHISTGPSQTIDVVNISIALGESSTPVARFTRSPPETMRDVSDTIIFEGTIGAHHLHSLPARENILRAKVLFSDNQEAVVSAAFKLVGTDAIITSLGEAYVDGPHLMIPIDFELNIDGIYRVQANLFDAASNQPVSHINALFKLDQENTSAALKVHAVTLRHSTYSGPYVLRDINLTRSPAHPGDQTGYGTSAQSSYLVKGFDLAAYDATEHEDPKAERRLEFLQRLAETN